MGGADEREVSERPRLGVEVPDGPVGLDRLIAHAGPAAPGSDPRPIGTWCRKAPTVGLE
jgi:hypothetical protein